MRLLKVDEDGDLSLTRFTGNRIPSYAILSHRWEADNEEVTFQDLAASVESCKSKRGYEKIQFCADQAKRDSLIYFWIDSVCIDKTRSAELQEAINSMFRWYQNSAKCYVYLSDVSHKRSRSSDLLWESAFRRSEWFNRGWTLQELLAPRSVEFFSRTNTRLGDKKSLEQHIHEITGIPITALQGRPLCQFSNEERRSWATKRETTVEEDQVYCLFGIFDVCLPLLYGEGKSYALHRLQDEIARRSTNNAEGYNSQLQQQVERQKPVELLDACGYWSPFHLEFIDSWDALLAVLDTKFKSRGLCLIERGQFVLEDADGNWEISGNQPFNKCFFPGQRVNMDAWVDESNVVKGRSSCPACQHQPLSSAIDCTRCGTYRRIEEIDETNSGERLGEQRRGEQKTKGPTDDVCKYRRIRIRIRKESRFTVNGAFSFSARMQPSARRSRGSRLETPGLLRSGALCYYNIFNQPEAQSSFFEDSLAGSTLLVSRY